MAKTNSLVSFFKEVKDELKKMNWPTSEQTFQTTVVVFVLVLLLTIYLGAADSVFSMLAAHIIG